MPEEPEHEAAAAPTEPEPELSTCEPPAVKARAEYASLCAKQSAGRSSAWAHLEPVLLEDNVTGQPQECKLRCKHCGSLFSARNPSRTVSDHLKACKKYAGVVPLKKQRTEPLAASAAQQAAMTALAAAVHAQPVPMSPLHPDHAAYYRPTASQNRQLPLEAGHSALLLIDTQNYNCHRGGALGSELQGEKYYWERIAAAQPLWAELVATARSVGIEVMYTVIQSLTRDGRDRGLDYKLSGFHVPPGSFDAAVLECAAPGPDDVVLPKTSSSVFGSTAIAYVLRNMGVRHLAVCGALTDQCVEHAVRDAADASFLVTMVTDACVTHSQQRHDASIAAVAGYCRQRTAVELIAEMRQLGGGGGGGAADGAAAGGGNMVDGAQQADSAPTDVRQLDG